MCVGGGGGIKGQMDTVELLGDLRIRKAYSGD